MTDAEKIAAGLSEELRVLWIRTVLAVNGTDPQRRAFIDGYNGGSPTPHASRRMLELNALGNVVRSQLEKPHGDR